MLAAGRTGAETPSAADSGGSRVGVTGEMKPGRAPLAPQAAILLTGASGYVGGRLLRALEARGLPRALPGATARDARGSGRPGHGGRRGRRARPAEPRRRARRRRRSAYYLVHSMGSSGAFEEADRQAARNFGDGGEGRRRASASSTWAGWAATDDALSPHLRSRQEVGRLLRESGVPVLEFRASIVIGSGSLSFEMIRSLVERLPVMITPRWVNVPAQPIAIDDLLAYLVAALRLPVVRVPRLRDRRRRPGHLRRHHARLRAAPRAAASDDPGAGTDAVPLQPVARAGHAAVRAHRPQADREHRPSRPWSATTRRSGRSPIRPVGVDEAVAAPSRARNGSSRATRWSDALSSAGEPPSLGRRAVRLAARRLARAAASPCHRRRAFAPIQRIGGDTGWYAWNSLWRLRGFLDLLAGGVGMRRGRPLPDDASRRRHGRLLARRGARAGPPAAARRRDEAARARVAGVRGDGRRRGRPPSGRPRSSIRWGLPGWAYWYALYPLHHLVFGGMLRGIASAAVQARPNR